MTTTILLADDHPVVRVGLRTLLEKERDFSIVGEAFDGIATVRMVQDLKPDVLVLDLMMPGMGGLYVTNEVKQCAPNLRIVILSMHADPLYVRESLRRGADGYVLKDTVTEEIVKAIRTVTAGRRYLSLPLDDREAGALTAPVDPCGRLTVREREIVSLVANGLHNKEIAGRCAISVRTVETHRAKIMRKLDLHNAAELIHFAVRKKIL